MCVSFGEVSQQLQMLEHDNHWNENEVRILSDINLDIVKDILHRLRLKLEMVQFRLILPVVRYQFHLPFINSRKMNSSRMFGHWPNYRNYDSLSARAMLAAKNTNVVDLNWKIQSQIPEDLRSYKSTDRLSIEDVAVNYPVEFLNSLERLGMPPHH